MKFGTVSPDIKFIQLEEMDDGRIRIEVQAKKKNGTEKTVCEVVDPFPSGANFESWAKPHLVRIGLKLMMA